MKKNIIYLAYRMVMKYYKLIQLPFLNTLVIIMSKRNNHFYFVNMSKRMGILFI